VFLLVFPRLIRGYLLRLGEMQPHKEYKFLQELVFEGIWPFNKFRSPYNILLLTLIYLWWGFLLFYYYNLSIFIFIIGLSSAIGISLWTYSIFNYASKLREIEVENITTIHKRFFIIYIDKLFHPGSIVIGVLMMTLTNYILIAPITGIDTGILHEIRNQTGINPLPAPFLVYVFFLSFDFSYRIGLITYLLLIQFYRNFLLSKYLSDPNLRDKFSPRFIRAIAKTDRSLYLVIISGILILPILYYDQVLLPLLIIYLIFTFILLTVNILYLFYLSDHALSPHILDILSANRIAYVGTFLKDNIPHCTPMIFVFDGKRIFLATSISSIKVKNLRKINQITLYFNHKGTKDKKPSQLEIQGKVRIYGYNTLSAVFYVFVFGIKMLLIRQVFNGKYPNYLTHYSSNAKYLPLKWRMFPILSRTLIEVIPYRMNFWRSNKHKIIDL
jgi:hypothetical protein